MKKKFFALFFLLLLFSSSLCACRKCPLLSSKEPTAYLSLAGASESRMVKAGWGRIRSFKPSVEVLTYADVWDPVRDELSEYYLFQPQIKAHYLAQAGDYVTVHIRVRRWFRTVLEEEFSFMLGYDSIPFLDAALEGKEKGFSLEFDASDCGMYRNLKGRGEAELVQIEKLIEIRPHDPAYDYEGCLRNSRNRVIVFMYQELHNEFFDYVTSVSTFDLSENDIVALAKFNADELEAQLLSLHSSLDIYLRGENMTLDDFSRKLKEDAEQLLKRVLFTGAAAERYGIAFPEDYWQRYQDFFKEHGVVLDPNDAVYRYKCLEKAVIEYFYRPILPDYVMGLESV